MLSRVAVVLLLLNLTYEVKNFENLVPTRHGVNVLDLFTHLDDCEIYILLGEKHIFRISKQQLNMPQRLGC